MTIYNQGKNRMYSLYYTLQNMNSRMSSEGWAQGSPKINCVEYIPPDF